MNIIGEGFPDEILNQVVQRQKVYGSGYAKGTSRSPEEILYLNANTSWCKLVSSVNFDDPPTFTYSGGGGSVPSSPSTPMDMPGNSVDLRNANFTVGATGNNGSPNNTSAQTSNNSMAKQFVLFNGTFNVNNGEQRAGIDTSTSFLGHNYAYGIGGTDFGLRPMMGIQSAEIKHATRGSIRQAVVKVKAFNKWQFDIIDALYLRLGFSVLLEWGHTMWYGGKDNAFHSGGDIENSLALDFLEGNGTYKDFLDKIHKRRLSSNGNYDAMFAKITNFQWSFLPDGSYDITINLISIGDVVESFKLNVFNSYTSTSSPGSSNENISPQDMSDREVINLYTNSNKIALWFNSLIGPAQLRDEPGYNPNTPGGYQVSPSE